MAKCKCGKVLSLEEIGTNIRISRDAGTPLTTMCQVCWESYVDHAINGT